MCSGTIDKNTEAGIYGSIDRINELFEEQIPIENRPEGRDRDRSCINPMLR